MRLDGDQEPPPTLTRRLPLLVRTSVCDGCGARATLRAPSDVGN
jgi:hypothetical protein